MFQASETKGKIFDLAFLEQIRFAVSHHANLSFMSYGERQLGKTELMFSGSKSLFDLSLKAIFTLKEDSQ